MKKKYTEEEKELAIAMWRESGLSRTKWCAQEGINRRTFAYWLKSKEPSKLSGFVPMQIESKDPKVGVYQLTYPNGVILNCPADTPLVDLGQLLTLHV